MIKFGKFGCQKGGKLDKFRFHCDVKAKTDEWGSYEDQQQEACIPRLSACPRKTKSCLLWECAHLEKASPPHIQFMTIKHEIPSGHTSRGRPFAWPRWFPSHAWPTRVFWRPKLPINKSPEAHFSQIRIFFIFCNNLTFFEVWIHSIAFQGLRRRSKS